VDIASKLGPYQIVSLLGVGGMGEVYRATDTNLKRQVAIKVLPTAVADDEQRLARFQREAHILAALNHPNIAHIHGLEKSNGMIALVLELVEGPTLADRIARGRMPLDEALPIAKQIAEALEAAHEQGIVHRDLKPANIKVRADGTAKVLDFGLAKAMDPAKDSSADASASRTLSTHGTHAGMILGTPAYMSPEQARGEAADKRADLWAFGVVLFEMLTGKPLFKGGTTSETLASVLTTAPDWTTLPAEAPAAIQRLLRRCLEKDRKRRIADASDARLEIEEAMSAPSVVTEAATRTNSTLRLLPWTAVAAVLLIGGAVAWRSLSRELPAPVYASIDAPAGYVLGEDDWLVSLPTRTPMVFTPDGHSLIIQAARAGRPQLFLRSLDHPDARPIAGTDDANGPFMSPDGKWIGFWAANEIRKIPIEGGTPTTICSLGADFGPIGASWGISNVIVFSRPQSGQIMRVSAGGGTPTVVTASPSPNHKHVQPFFLPDGKRFLFSDVSIVDATDARLIMQSIDGGDARIVVESATDGRLLPSGHLAFMRLGTLMIVPFDQALAEVTGDAVAAMSNVMQSGLRARAYANNTGAGMFAVSSAGTLAVIRGPLTGGQERGPLNWVSRDGHPSPAEPTSGAPVGSRLYTRISPDQSRAIVTLITPTRFELWLADWKRDVWTLCGDCNANLLLPVVWSPDGRRLLISRGDALATHALDGSMPDEILVREADRSLSPASWLPDGRVVYRSITNGAGAEIKLLEPKAGSGRVIVPLLKGTSPAASPDGRWLAYASITAPDKDLEVAVQALQGPQERIQVSAGGGQEPVWSTDSRTLYYLHDTPDSPSATHVLSVDVVADGALKAGIPRELFVYPYPEECNGLCHDVSADGRFLFRGAINHTSVTRMDLVLNWTATLPKGR
jgi:Tol biopolymer transport system component/tRNA A-37 threonylcarbamoyl transferase component Bud32